MFFAGCGKKQKNYSENKKKPLIAKSFIQSQQRKPQLSEMVIRKKSGKKNEQKAFFNEKSKEKIQQIEARLSDVPVPLLAKLLSVSDDQKGCYCLFYEITMEFSELISFYTSEMTSMGWKEGVIFLNEEYLASFKKDHHSCVLLLRPGLVRWGKKKPATIRLYIQL